MNSQSFKKFSLFSLSFTFFVILWGAWVRFSHSGEGCGNDWPLCKGQIIPENSLTSFIEWFHRLTSGLSLIFILILFVLALKIYPSKHFIRKAASASLVFILLEALIGAILVLAQLTGSNSSFLRVTLSSFHLMNSLLLVATLVICYAGASFKSFKLKKPHIYFLLLFPLLAFTGNIASLAGTLFPSSSLVHALTLDFLPESHMVLKLRILHPILAAGFFFALLWNANTFKILSFLTLCTFLLGLITLLTLSPVFMKLIHLFMAYTLWMFFVKETLKEELIS